MKKEKVLIDAKPTFKTASYDGRFKRHDAAKSEAWLLIRPTKCFDGRPELDFSAGGVVWFGLEVVKMFVRASEAKEMYCPMGFANPEGPWIKCGAEDCMAWRVFTVSEKSDDEDIGYCGLVGKPEV